MKNTIADTLKTKGRSKNRPDSDFNAKELKMGIEVEKEHVSDPKVTKEIAKDHLVEIPDYYTRLKEMEDEAKADEKKKIKPTMDAVIAFLKKHPNPSDDELHAWSKKKNLDNHIVEALMYKLATKQVKKSEEGSKVKLYNVNVLSPTEFIKAKHKPNPKKAAERREEEKLNKEKKKFLGIGKKKKGGGGMGEGSIFAKARPAMPEGTIHGKYKKVGKKWVEVPKEREKEIGARAKDLPTLKKKVQMLKEEYESARKTGDSGAMKFYYASAMKVSKQIRELESHLKKPDIEKSNHNLVMKGGKRYPIGTVMNYGGKKYRKVAANRWVVISSETEKSLADLEKALPTVVRIKEPEPKPNKEIPQVVKTYVKEVENAFVIMNKAVKDLIESIGLEDAVCVVKPYVEFKKEFQWKVNDAINYPRVENAYDGMAKIAGSDESRVNPEKVK